jgi:glutamine synthetase
VNDDGNLASAAGRSDFIARHGLWNDEQHAAAAALDAELDSVDFVRVVFGDPHGLARSKTVSTAVFRTVLRNGMDFSPGPFIFDTGHAVAIDFFAHGGGIGIDELTGAGDFIVVPDPLTFQTLPHTGRRIGWVIGDEYLRDGRPHPLSSRGVLRRLCDRLAERDLEFVVGLEAEWYLTRFTDGHRVGPIGGFGVQGTPPVVEPVNGGYQFNSDSLLDAVLPVIDPVIDALLTMGLPLRGIEHESGPGQLEFTFNPVTGLAAADTMLLFRTLTKQILARHGYHASFMALPALDGFDPSGWHLHQSLAERSTGRNVFVAKQGTEVLSEPGMSYLGGLLDHAAEASLLCAPTVNGYRRMQAGFSLSPDRIAWCTENRGAFLRVIGAGGEPGSHIENRTGEPCANPYLYLASQLSAGLDGIDNALDPGAPATDPHAPTAASLPTTLAEALEAFTGSALCRDVLGVPLHECLRRLKESEQARYAAWCAEAGIEDDDRVSDWEHREYFASF